jgi:hypothetical protein
MTYRAVAAITLMLVAAADPALATESIVGAWAVTCPEF